MADEEIAYGGKLDNKQVLQALKQIEKTAGDTAKGINEDFQKVGAAAQGASDDIKGMGKATEGFYRDANGRLRDAKGKFVSLGNSASEAGQKIKGVGGAADEAGNSLGGIGVKGAASFGLVSGAVQALTIKVLELGAQVISVFGRIAAESVSLASGLEQNQLGFKNILEGSDTAAIAVLERVRGKALEIGGDVVGLQGLTRAFLPDVKDLDQLDQLLATATALQSLAPEQGAEGVRLALEEALSGDPLSLVKRFDLPGAIKDQIKEAQKEFGPLDGLLKALGTEFERQGVDVEAFASTAAGQFQNLKSQLQQLQTVGGGPVLEQLKEILGGLNAFLIENSTELTLFATSIGDAAASALEFINSLIPLDQISGDQIVALGQYIFRVVEAVKLFVGQAAGWLKAVGDITGTSSRLSKSLEFLGWILGNIDDALVTGAQILALSKAGYEGLYAAIQPVLKGLQAVFQAAADAATLDYLGAAKNLGTAIEELGSNSLDLAAGQDAARKSLEESLTQINAYNQSVQDQAKSQEELRAEIEKGNQAGEDEANAILARKAAAQEAIRAEEEYAAAKEKTAKIDEEIAEQADKLTKELISQERKRLEAAIDAAQKREDIARKNQQKIEDIYRKNEQAIADAGKDLSREESDIARKNARARIDLEREQAQKRVDIETNFRRKLEDIQNQFNQSAEEAERSRDAVAFLQAQRSRDEQIKAAETDRKRSIEDTKIEGERRKEELALQRERELEDAKIANQRKLEDLQLSLERELEEQRIANERDIQEQTLSEQRKTEEMARGNQQRLDDMKADGEKRLEELRTQLEKELELVKEYEAKKTEAQSEGGEAGESKTAPGKKPGQKQPGAKSPGSKSSKPKSPGTKFGGSSGSVPGLAGGGPAYANRPYIIGERGPEVFVPKQSGTVVPNGLMFSPPPSGGGKTINNITKNATANVDPGVLSASQEVRVRNIVLDIMDELGDD